MAHGSLSHGWFTAFVFAGAFGCYLLLAGSLTGTELAAAIVSAAAVAGFTTIQRLYQRRPLTLTRPPARLLLRTLAAFVTDTGHVGLALFRALAGSTTGAATWQQFYPGGQNPHDAGRRALVTLFTSMAPNGLVLDLRPSALSEADAGLLLHRLVPASPLLNKDWPA